MITLNILKGKNIMKKPLSIIVDKDDNGFFNNKSICRAILKYADFNRKILSYQGKLYQETYFYDGYAELQEIEFT